MYTHKKNMHTCVHLLLLEFLLPKWSGRGQKSCVTEVCLLRTAGDCAGLASARPCHSVGNGHPEAVSIFGSSG